MKNWIKYILTPTYKVTYAPAKSQKADAIQVYKVAGNPASAGWVSKDGHKLFTLPVVNHGYKYQSFRCDRVLGVSFAIM